MTNPNRLTGRSSSSRRRHAARRRSPTRGTAEIAGTTRASGAFYRAGFGPEGLRQSRARAERRLPMPVLAFGADAGVGSILTDTMRQVAHDVRGGVFGNCGHYVPEEAPLAVLDQLRRFHHAVGGQPSAVRA